MMTHIELKNVDVKFPVHDLQNANLRNDVIRKLSFGLLESSRQHKVAEVHALKNISLNILAKDRVGIIGLNGAGKTTMLQTIAGIYRPVYGTRHVSGRISALYNIGVGFDVNASGYENIILRSMFMGLSKKAAFDLIPEIEEFTELGDFLNMPIRIYSAGMQIKLAFAISTSVNPEILLMDEWIGAGDQSFREKAQDRLKDVVQKSSILVLTSHSESLVKNNCSKCILLHKGEVIEYTDTNHAFKTYHKMRAGKKP